LNGKAQLRLEANYFNEELSEWEPLIEKLETKDGLRPWELSVGVRVWYGVLCCGVLCCVVLCSGMVWYGMVWRVVPYAMDNLLFPNK
jgi:hypothetical protein